MSAALDSAQDPRALKGNMKRPNVLFVFADEWRAQATRYAGDPNCETPTLDALAAGSVNVTHAVSGCPVCCPYRASLLTGQYPLTHGVFINDVELDPRCHSIARAFGAGGYHTGYIGKWHVYGSPEGRCERRQQFVPRSHQMGFDEWQGFECTHNYQTSRYYCNDDPTPRLWDGYDAFPQSRAAVEYMAERKRTGEPFLLMLSWGPPHFPLHTAPDPYRARYAGRELALRDNVPAGRHDHAQEELRGYYAHIAALDDALKIVLDGLRDLGLADDTIVVFTSDHGDMRQSQGLETKLFPWDESIRVPFLLRHPGLPRSAGTRVPAPIDAPDIMPTLLRLCDLHVPDSVEGRDWSAEITGRRPVDADSDALLGVAAETTELRFNGMHAWRGLRTLRYTYVRNTEGPWLLYDNEADPYQKCNLIGDPEHRCLAEKLDRRLTVRLAERGDEFLPGAAYLARAGLSHYREAHSSFQRTWRDPWAESGGLGAATEGRETVR